MNSFLDVDGKYTTIDDPLANGTGTAAESINNSGQIVGFYGSFPDHGFITAPVNLVETAAQLEGLTTTQIDAQASQGVSYLVSTSPATDVEFNAAQSRGHGD